MSNYCEHDSSWWEETDDDCQFCTQCSVSVCPYCGAHFIETGVGMDTGDSQYGPPCDCLENESLMAFESAVECFANGGDDV